MGIENLGAQLAVDRKEQAEDSISLSQEEGATPVVDVSSQSIEADASQIEQVRSRLGLSSRREVVFSGLAAAASLFLPKRSRAETPETSQEQRNSTYYRQGIENLYKHAERATKEAAWVYHTLPNGETQWISIETPGEDYRFSNGLSSSQTTFMDGEKMHSIISALRKGGSIEFIHTHPSKAFEATNREIAKRTPPSAIDVMSMLGRYTLALEKRVKNPIENITNTVVTESGIWQYTMDSKSFRTFNKAFNQKNPFLKEIQSQSKKDNGKAFISVLSKMLDSFEDDIEELTNKIATLDSKDITASNREALISAFFDNPFLLYIGAEGYENIKGEELEDDEKHIGELFVQARNAIAEILDDLYYGDTEKSERGEGVGYRILFQPQVSLQDDYIENWGKLGVTMSFIPRKSVQK